MVFLVLLCSPFLIKSYFYFLIRSLTPRIFRFTYISLEAGLPYDYKLLKLFYLLKKVKLSIDVCFFLVTLFFYYFLAELTPEAAVLLLLNILVLFLKSSV